MTLPVGHCACSNAFPAVTIDTSLVPNLWKRSTILQMPKNNQPREFNDVGRVAQPSLSVKCCEGIVLKQLPSKVSFPLDLNHLPNKQRERDVEN